jgi:hypothetical protein
LLIGSLFVVGSLAHLDAGEVTDAADADAVAAIEKLGGSVREIAANSEDRNVEFHLGGRELTDDGLALVAALKNVVALNLKNTQITSAGLVHLKGLTKLRRLHLEKTAVDDDGLVHLAGLTNLEYLNLYGTKISNKSLSQITSLKKLRRLYVWQTDVTDEGVAQLAKALPELKVVQGVDLSKLPPPPPVKPPTPIKWIAAGGPQPPRSKNGSSTEVVFQNKSDRKVKIVWVGYDGNLRHYHDLNPGETKRQNTYADNTWVITDENDKPLGHFIVGSDVALAVIPK